MVLGGGCPEGCCEAAEPRPVLTCSLGPSNLSHPLLGWPTGKCVPGGLDPGAAPYQSTSAKPVFPECSPIPERSRSVQEELICRSSEVKRRSSCPYRGAESTRHMINLRVQRPLSSFVSQRCVKMLMKGVIIYENFTIKM